MAKAVGAGGACMGQVRVVLPPMWADKNKCRSRWFCNYFAFAKTILPGSGIVNGRGSKFPELAEGSVLGAVAHGIAGDQP